MKIMMISSLYGFAGGGAGLVAHNLARALAAAGHQLSVVTIGGTRHYSIMEEQDIKIFRFIPQNLYPLQEKDLHPGWQKVIWQLVDTYNFQCANELRKILIHETPDIIHIHKMRGFSGAVWHVASRFLPGRVIQTCHDYESMSPDGYLRGSVGRMALHRQWPVRGYQLLRARFSAGVSVVTAPSNFTLKRITESGLFPLARSDVVWNTHDWSHSQLRAIHERANTVSNDPVCFLFLGRLEREKGVVELCEAFLLASRSNPRMQLRLAGWGTLESKLRAKYGGNSRIDFLGAIAGREKEEALANSTAVIIPSLWEEVFGVVTVEAFAFGKPVIASRVGGLPELVRTGETGWLVEAGNIPALAEQLLFVANIDPLALEKINQNCKEYSHEFAVEKILTEYLEIYNQLLQ